jgi:hypothetical protein
MCVIASLYLENQSILAKNRDRKYKASIKVIHELKDGVEVLYIQDLDTGWAEGLNEYGIGVTNATVYPVDIRLTGGTTGAMVNIQPSPTTRPAIIRFANTGTSNMITGLLNSSGAGQGISGLPAYAGMVGMLAGTSPLILVTNATERVRVTDTGLVGIGTTNPRTPLQVETYGVKTGIGTFTASVGVSTTIDSFSVSSTDFKIAEYTVHIGFGSYIQAQKVLITQNQTTAYSQEYGVMYDNSLLVSIGATITGGNCILQATPQTGVSGLTTYRFARNTLL